MAWLARLIAKWFNGFKITRSLKIEVNGKDEIVNVISNKGVIVTIPTVSCGEIFFSENLFNRFTSPELDSILCHEIYHKYHPKIKTLEMRFKKMYFPKQYLSKWQKYFPFIFKYIFWEEEIKADLFATLKSNKRLVLKFLGKKIQFRINPWKIDLYHPPIKLRKWIVKNYGF